MNFFIQYKSFVKGAKPLVIQLKPLQANFTVLSRLLPFSRALRNKRAPYVQERFATLTGQSINTFIEWPLHSKKKKKKKKEKKKKMMMMKKKEEEEEKEKKKKKKKEKEEEEKKKEKQKKKRRKKKKGRRR